ncbi:MAG: phospholipase D-like domain-containing protein [Bdellovibrionales bacterium]|jgi:phosphatidylserine/phosphatidylglycerophosphate/cardiolipin synthase-like enzyme|nr:phospholipase D-like domain-containing protein [Bdellovibrionales bacterium]
MYMQKVSAALLSLTLTLPAVAAPIAPAHAGWGPFETGELTVKEILADSTSGALSIDAARVITDNDAAFASKLETIRGAQKSLRLVYYIFSNDHSSSVLAEELIAAAQRGVRVKLLLDYHTNYKHLDLLSALEREGAKSSRGGGIEVRLFNRPTREVMKDAYFLSSYCGAPAKTAGITACSTEKLAALEAFFQQEPTSKTLGGSISNLSSTFMGLFLSGLYSKHAGAIQTAVFAGGDIDPKSLASGGSAPSADEVEQLKDFGRLVFDAKFKGSLESKIKLALAFSLYGEQVGPIYQILSSTLPVERERNSAAKMDWKHLTDFTHHKLLVADDLVVQLGGRNIEDSYHTQPSKLTAKYTFMDTDMWVRLKKADNAVGKSFDRLFDFRAMTADLKEIRQHAPNDMLKNLDQAKTAMGLCQNVKAQQEKFASYDSCVGNTFKTLPHSSVQQRMDEAIENMKTNAAIYRNDYRPTPLAVSDALDPQDVRSMLLTYIENVPFNRKDAVGAEKRIYGSVQDRDTQNGKSIHSLWTQGLRNACKTSYDSKQKKYVILHQGYVLFPGNLMIALGSMFNGSWDCRNVDILIVTNSVETTDLNVINFFARHQLKALLEKAQSSSSPGKARIRIYEHQTSPGQPALSLHSKVNILGDDVIIGSANADVRSYFMDTNNGFFFRGAKQFIDSYQKSIASLLSDSSRTKDVSKTLLQTSTSTMIAQDIAGLKAMIQAKDKKGRLTPAREQMLADLVTRIQTHVYKVSRQLLDTVWIEVPMMSDSVTSDENERLRLQQEISNDFNSLMMLL